MSLDTVSGSCLCNAVRFTVEGPPSNVCICHCTMCRRAVGAPAVAWASFRRAGLAVEGAVTWHASSNQARRGFCGVCGSSLFFVSRREPGAIDITVATLQDADQFAPQHHVWTPHKLAWEKLGDGLPQYREDTGSEQIDDLDF
jgi:hypothetical protein